MHDAAAGGVAGRSLGADGPGAVDASDEPDSDDGEDTTAVALPAPSRPTPPAYGRGPSGGTHTLQELVSSLCARQSADVLPCGQEGT